MDDKDLFSYSEPEESKNESLDLNSFSSGAADKARQQKTKKQERKRKIIIIPVSFLLVLVIALSGIVGVVILWLSTFDASVDYDLSDLELNFTTTIYVTDKDNPGQWKEYQRLHGEFNRIWVSYHAELAQDQKDGKETAAQYTGIPKRLADAFVAVEDKRFYTHYGVDWRRTTGAIINTFIPIYSSKQGGSTITQQLIKNLTDDREQNASRKVREIMRARYIEKNYAKETILECYLNTIPMGHGIYGVEVAANYYFGKSVNELTLLECAALASITKAPSTYAPDDNPEKNKERRETVLSLMLDQKLITQKEHDAALQEEFKVVASRESLNESKVNNYFVDALIVDVTNDLAEKYGWDDAHAAENFYTGGYKIYATLDPDIQETVDEVFTNSEKYGLKGKDGQQLQGAFTIMDYNGRVRGMSGGIGKKEANLGLSGFNRATDAIRQPGSTMKPIAAYAPAIESGKIHYSSMLNDTAVNYNGWTPKNWYNSYWGNVTTQYALERSINTVPVALVNEMGPQSCYDFVTQKLGVTTLNKNDIALSPLGMGGTNGGITTIESAAAYQVFGNGGRYYEPTLYYAVYDQRNEQVLSNENMTPSVAISEDTATVMNKLLQTVVYGSNGTGRAAAGYIKNMKIYAKTGTSNNANDLWFVGGSPYYVASCWCGYDNQQSISDSGIAHKMWGAVMSKIHAELQPRDFDISSYATQRYYCTETGALATDACPSKATGWYTNSTKPSVCKSHQGTLLGTPEEEAKKEEESKKPEEGTEEGDNSSNAENSESTENTESTESTESTTPSEDSQTDENTENGENAE